MYSAMFVGIVSLPAKDVVGQAFFIVFALPLPILTASFARSRVVHDWLAADRR